MGSNVNQNANLVVLSSADWAKLRPRITELYQDQRWSQDRVRDYLIDKGFRVNTRMVRGRIAQWNLQRNFQLRDIAAALRLLGPDSANWPSPEPRFLIRGHQVTLYEVLEVCRRRRKPQPFQWAQTFALDSEESHVSLVDEITFADLSIGISERAETPSTHSSAMHTSASSSTSASASTPTSTLTPIPRPTSVMQRTPSPVRIITPQQSAVAHVLEYCADYGALVSSDHHEPEVHQYTIHGQFGNRMKDGLAHMMRNSPNNAFPHYRHGFELVRSLLLDCHPMALAQYLAVICQLETQREQVILSSLLRYTADMASSLPVSRRLVEILYALRSSHSSSSSVPSSQASQSSSNSQSVSIIAIACLRAATGSLTNQNSNQWKRFYIQERLCDSLYYCNSRVEGSAHRATLLRDQEVHYGACKRNVIWTLMNVANDQEDSGDVGAAEMTYTIALVRSDEISGFSQAKVRFAALEGLARIKQLQWEQINRRSMNLAPDDIDLCLQDAYRYVNDAYLLALDWFEPASRAICRITEQRTEVMNLLASNGLQPHLG